MGRKLYLSIFISILSILSVHAQNGEIQGKVTEVTNSEPVAFATVAAMQNGTVILAAPTDFDGVYKLKPLPPGKYDIKVVLVGYTTTVKAGVQVSIDNIATVDIQMGKGIDIEAVDITDYAIPVIDQGNTATAVVISKEQILAAPTRDVNSIVSQGTGTYQKDEGDAINIRGSRSDGTYYIVDGMKVKSAGVPQAGMEQITVITGGVAAQYGDLTGGVISVTTRGPSSTFGGGIELATSELLDSYGYNLASINLTGPIFTRKDSTGKKTGQPVAGFFLAAEYQYDKDPNPSPIDIYKVNDGLLSEVQKNPLVASPAGTGYIHRSSYFTNSDFTTQKFRENVAQNAMRFNGKIDIKPAKNFEITLGGSYEKIDDREYVDIYSLMNYENNPQKVETEWRTFARFTQRFNSNTNSEKSATLVQNAYYTIQVDYTNHHRLDQNATHKDKIFDYGYVGKFTSHYVPVYEFGTTNGNDTLTAIQNGNASIQTDFIAGTVNPTTSNYTSQYYELTQPFGVFGNTDNQSNIETNGGLLNKDNRLNLNVYGIWATPGRVGSAYGFTDNSQARFSAQGSADIKNHNIMIGLEYEQRTDRGYRVITNDLWTLMRLLGNQKLSGVDPTSGDTLYATLNGLPAYAVNYNRGLYTQSINKDGEAIASGFYENIRTKLGLSMTDTIQTDSYDPSTYNLDMFAVDELLNNGNPYINYFGYDYTGTDKMDGSWDLKDFYVNKDQDNNYLRKVDAFRPIYIAGYIQDKFKYNDILFNIGVRIDRFDANQKVLKDPYSLYEIHKAGDQETYDLLASRNKSLPGNIKDDYAVYVNNIQSPTDVVGYRNGSNWYDADGTITTDLSSLTQGSSIQPYITNYEDYQKSRVNPNAFKDYEPQVTYMPRVAFSFPISDDAYFAAHYEVLTQRPQDNDYVRFNPITYLNWSQGQSGNFANPDLKPEQTTQYEINFQQKLSRSSKFGISTFYKEMKDMIHYIAVDYAFPIDYKTYGNIDFGTIKGLTFDYDLRRTSNIRMTLSYTLSFADGTGSSPTTNSGILSQQGQTNLREIKPLDFDQRHTFVASIDFHYASGKEYNGPVWFKKQFFANAGANFVFRAGSGTPYTRKSNITPEADFTTTANNRSVIAGSVNGSRYPWSFKVDAKFDKNFELRGKTDKDGNPRRVVYASVYLQVLNLFNTKNVTTVWSATGSPEDDGYIDSPGAQAAIDSKTNPQSYIDMYRIAVNDADNYSLPRRIRLGVSFNF